MIAISPMFEANLLSTAKNYWFGKKPEMPSDAPDPRKKIMTAARKTIGKEEGGVGGALRNVLNRRDLLAQAAGN